ncbi:hypothetical protein QAD02_003011 [Eretmocerus hayati]|uniref:Uncharacterized protein n=1 Tax=Eretmocerus hayati TaxID=131215 RepID=A0ACC2NKY4_9HYME|nr:hypothetical protein QAD02_003011 [Eretmocerus hayati]
MNILRSICKKTHKRFFFEETRKSDIVKNVYVKHGDGKPFDGTGEDLCNLMTTPTPIPIYDSRASRYVKTYEESLHRIGSGEIKPLYGTNMDLDCKSELDDIPLLISDKWNNQNDPSQPIKYAKEWHFIINDDVQYTIKKFAGDAEIMSKEGVLDGYRPGCFVKCCVKLQVLNLDVNGAVAVNVGSPLWHVCHRLSGTCYCPGNAVKWLRWATDIYGDMYLRKIRNIFTCPEIDCDDTFATQTALNTHILHHHLSQPIAQNYDCSMNLTPISGPVGNDLSESGYLHFEAVPELFICPKETCSLAYMTRFAPKNHIEIHHSEQAAQNSSIMATSLSVDSIPSQSESPTIDLINPSTILLDATTQTPSPCHE